MLLSKEVEVTLEAKTTKYYEALGYKIPRRKNKWGKITVPQGSKINVNVEDLPKNSHFEVDIECDYCHTPNSISYSKYNAHLHKDGKYYCHSCACKIFNGGENHPNWNSNLTQEERENGRNYPEYTEFIKKVLTRDNYTCQVCEDKNGSLEVHHLDGYDWCKEKRTDETNGVALCKNCHSNFHAHYGRGGNTKEQFEEWCGKAIELLKYNGEIQPCRAIYCIEDDKVYLDGVKEIKNIFKHSCHKIYDVCNKKEKSFKNKHYLWHDEYLKMSEEDIQKYLKWCNENERYTKVICLTTKEIFISLNEAERQTGVDASSIGNCCRGVSNYAGVSEDGIKLKWMYLEEFNNLTKEEQEKILSEKPKRKVYKEEVCEYWRIHVNENSEKISVKRICDIFDIASSTASYYLQKGNEEGLCKYIPLKKKNKNKEG